MASTVTVRQKASIASTAVFQAQLPDHITKHGFKGQQQALTQFITLQAIHDAKPPKTRPLNSWIAYRSMSAMAEPYPQS